MINISIKIYWFITPTFRLEKKMVDLTLLNALKTSDNEDLWSNKKNKKMSTKYPKNKGEE